MATGRIRMNPLTDRLGRRMTFIKCLDGTEVFLSLGEWLEIDDPREGDLVDFEIVKAHRPHKRKVAQNCRRHQDDSPNDQVRARQTVAAQATPLPRAPVEDAAKLPIPELVSSRKAPTEPATLDPQATLDKLVAGFVRTQSALSLSALRGHVTSPNWAQRLLPEGVMPQILKATLSGIRAKQMSPSERESLLQNAVAIACRAQELSAAQVLYEKLAENAGAASTRAAALAGAGVCAMKLGPPHLGVAIGHLMESVRLNWNPSSEASLARAAYLALKADELAEEEMEQVRAVIPDLDERLSQLARLEEERAGASERQEPASIRPEADLPQYNLSEPFVRFVVRQQGIPSEIIEAQCQSDPLTAREQTTRAERMRKRLRQPSFSYDEVASAFGAASRIYLNILESGNLELPEAEYSDCWSRYLASAGPKYLVEAIDLLRGSDSDAQARARLAADAAADHFAEGIVLSRHVDRLTGDRTGIVRQFLQQSYLKCCVISSLGGSPDEDLYPLAVRSPWDWRGLVTSPSAGFRSIIATGLGHLASRTGPRYVSGLISDVLPALREVLSAAQEAQQRLSKKREKVADACATALRLLSGYQDIVHTEQPFAVLLEHKDVFRTGDQMRVQQLCELHEECKVLLKASAPTQLDELSKAVVRLSEVQASIKRYPTFLAVTLLNDVCERMISVLSFHLAYLRDQTHAVLSLHASNIAKQADGSIRFTLWAVNDGTAVARNLQLHIADATLPDLRIPLIEARAGDVAGRYEVECTAPSAISAADLDVTYHYEEHGRRVPETDERRCTIELNFGAAPPVDRGMNPWVQVTGCDPASPIGAEPGRCVGREELVSRIAAQFLHPTTSGRQLMLYGLPRVGKTSVLRKVVQSLRGHNVSGRPVLPVRVLAGGIGAEKNPMNGIANVVCQELLHRSETEPDTAEVWASLHPRLLERASDIDRWQELVDAVREAGLWLVLLLDEFNIFWRTHGASLGDGFFLNMRELASSVGAIGYCGQWQLRDMLFDEDMPLRLPQAYFTTTMRETVGPLDDTGCRTMVEDGCSRTPNSWLVFEEGAIGHIAYLSGGLPCYVALLCQRLWENATDSVLVTKTRVGMAAAAIRDDTAVVSTIEYPFRAEELGWDPWKQSVGVLLLTALAEMALDSPERSCSLDQIVAHLQDQHKIVLPEDDRIANTLLRMEERHWIRKSPLSALPYYNLAAPLIAHTITGASYRQRHFEQAAASFRGA